MEIISLSIKYSFTSLWNSKIAFMSEHKLWPDSVFHEKMDLLSFLIPMVPQLEEAAKEFHVTSVI